MKAESRESVWRSVRQRTAHFISAQLFAFRQSRLFSYEGFTGQSSGMVIADKAGALGPAEGRIEGGK